VEISSSTVKALEQAARNTAKANDLVQGTIFTSFRAARSSKFANSQAEKLKALEGSLPEGAVATDTARAVTLLGEYAQQAQPGIAKADLKALGSEKLAPASEALRQAYEAASGKPLWTPIEAAFRKHTGHGDVTVPPPVVHPRPGVPAPAEPARPVWSPIPFPEGLKKITGSDMTEEARRGTYEPVVGREQEIDEAIEILTRRKNNNVALVGPPGVGKTAIAQGVAQRIIDGTAPGLENVRLLSINMDKINSKWRGEFEGQLTKAIETAQATNGKVILFADEMHRLLSAGAHSEDGSPGGDIIKPALANGTLRMMGATTNEEFRTGVEVDAAFARRWERVEIDPPNDEQSITIAKSMADGLEQDYDVVFDDGVSDKASKLALEYVHTTNRPDSILKILTPAATLARREGRAAGVSSGAHVTLDHLRRATSKVAGVPVPLGNFDKARNEKLLHAEEFLRKSVYGQDPAIGIVADALRRAEAGLKPDNLPIGSFAFIGPTGVGKTELAKSVANFLFDDPKRIMKINGSEFQHPGAELSLIKGKDGAGTLTEYVRQNPYSVVLFDEVEKADASLHKLMLQILDEGELTDGAGRVVDFSNTVVILTSNAGAREVLAAKTDAERTEVAKKALRKVFSPELYNRIGDVVGFQELKEEDMRKVTQKLADIEIAENVQSKRNVNVTFTKGALDKVTAAGFSPQDGARPLRRALQRFVSNPLAKVMLDGSIPEGSTVAVKSRGKDLIFTVEGKEVARSTPEKLEEDVVEEESKTPDINELMKQFGGDKGFGN
jgi:ATP-dependent Clp protease ATP-binding subunit ClpC